MPKGCCRIIYYADEYREPYECNFLGMSPSVQIEGQPKHSVILDIDDVGQRYPDATVSEDEDLIYAKSFNRLTSTEPPTDLEKLHYSITSLMPLPDKREQFEPVLGLSNKQNCHIFYEIVYFSIMILYNHSLTTHMIFLCEYTERSCEWLTMTLLGRSCCNC